MIISTGELVDFTHSKAAFAADIGMVPVPTSALQKFRAALEMTQIAPAWFWASTLHCRICCMNSGESAIAMEITVHSAIPQGVASAPKPLQDLRDPCDRTKQASYIGAAIIRDRG